MGALPLALSVHNFISSVGADAGFASIIGLAILILLYFAHARETSALREQAARLAERLQQAEAKLAQSAGAQAAVPPPSFQPAQASAAAPVAQPATAAAVGAAAKSVAATAGGAPAGLAAPALASATRFVPVGGSIAPAPPAAAPARAVPAAAPRPAVPAAAPQPAAATAIAQPPAPAVVSAAAPDEEPVRVGAAATAAGAANGGARSAPAGIPGSAVRRPPPRPPAGAGRPATASGRPLPPLATSAPTGSSAARRFVIVVLGALVVAGAVAALLIAISSSGTKSITKLTPTSNAPAAKHRSRPAFNPATVTVAVLNGTATNDLAHRVATRLASMGYRKGAIATATDQTRTATVVAYRPGFRTDAVHVASALRLRAASVQPIDQSTQQVACAGATACTVNVVVTVGADLATS
jgi:hypothetical protein